MNDFAAALAPKSDQINAMDLVGADLTVTITGVKVTPGTEQPVSISLAGTPKVWRPCKTTGRILMAAWGADTSQFVGRSVQLCLDPKVKWGGLEVGGIRIRALSHIDDDLKIVVAESKQVRKPVTVKRLQIAAEQPAAMGQDLAKKLARAAAEKGTDHFRTWFNSDEGKACRQSGVMVPDFMDVLKATASGADEMRTRMTDDPFSTQANPPTDAEIEAQIRAEQARYAADLEGRS